MRRSGRYHSRDASAADLKERVHARCVGDGHNGVDQIKVTTLHSLALRLLKKAGLLKYYPSDPLVLDDWELETIFDAEFGKKTSLGKKRRREIRREHEAFWSTGSWGPPNYIPPNPPITDEERQAFHAFHGPRTRTYACVLPGELIRECVKHIKSGSLDPAALLGLQHLIVDEFQDLNPLDLQLIEALAADGVVLFVAGDDDQSIYSFRYASPTGIQKFVENNPGCGAHTLNHCFRCTPTVLAAATALIEANAGIGRVPKKLVSLFAKSDPPVQGAVYRWKFASDVAEARAVAETCRDLIAAGLAPREILILLTKRAIGELLAKELANRDVDCDSLESERFHDTKTGRLLLALLRIVCSRDDYVAHRIVLGLTGGSDGTCTKICDNVISHNQNFRDLFYKPLANGVFSGRERTAIGNAAEVIRQVSTWKKGDPLSERRKAITTILSAHCDEKEINSWHVQADELPQGTTLGEVCDYLWADTDEQTAALLKSIYDRLEEPVPEAHLLPQRVRAMTMHGAKGLSAQVVIIPGLEHGTLPAERNMPYPGLVLEAARLLYVSVTRARVACIVTYARFRRINGRNTPVQPSQFASELGGAFATRGTGLIKADVAQVLTDYANSRND